MCNSYSRLIITLGTRMLSAGHQACCLVGNIIEYIEWIGPTLSCFANAVLWPSSDHFPPVRY